MFPLLVFSSIQSFSCVQLFTTPWTAGFRLPCPSPTPKAYSNSCPSSWWFHPTISSSVIPFSSRLQSFPVSGSFQMSQFFTSGGQKFWSFSFSISPSSEYSGLISFRMDWLDLHAVQETFLYSPTLTLVGNGKPLQYSCLENSIDRGGWQATVHGVTKSRTWQRLTHTHTHTHTHIHTEAVVWRRKWQPTPILLPGESHGMRILEGYNPWGRKESDTTEWLTHTQTHTHIHTHILTHLYMTSGKTIALTR